MKHVTIKWEDHHSDGGWKTPKELRDWAVKPNICTSMGWVTYEDKNVIVLSSSFDGHESYGENMCILKKCIIK